MEAPYWVDSPYVGALDVDSSGVEGGPNFWLVRNGCILGMGIKSGEVVARRSLEEGLWVAVSEIVG